MAINIPLRFEEEVMSMARELEEKDREYEECVMALTTVLEMANVGEPPQFLSLCV